MPADGERLGIGAFACAFGDRERSPESIEDVEAICSAKGLSLSLAAMGCGTFWQMTRPLESYILESIAATLSLSGIIPQAVDHIIFATSDSKLRFINSDFTRSILQQLDLINCIPTVLSLQQCASSLTAVDYVAKLFVNPALNHAIVVAFDFVPDDRDRIQPFALFGDAVASCMISRIGPAKLSLSAYEIGIDFDGILGRDSFASRKHTAVAALQKVTDRSGVSLANVVGCFSTNFYKPVAMFNANICGLRPEQLHIETLHSRAHCGNCDWMINLLHHQEEVGLADGESYLVQSFAPGFFACGMLAASA